jgi:hypothetical protein
MVYSNNEKLTATAVEITTGLLLDDGNLQKPRTCRNYRFRFGQNSTRKNYVWHVFKIYQNGLKPFDEHKMPKTKLLNNAKRTSYLSIRDSKK